MIVRCKFLCQHVKKFRAYDGRMLYEARFTAVTSGSPENKAFFDATPSGILELATYKEDLFPVGAEIYVDLTLTAEA